MAPPPGRGPIPGLDALLQMVSLAPAARRHGSASAVVGYLSMRRSEGSIAALDGLRAFAILFVFLRHAARPFLQDDVALLPFLDWELAVPLSNGWIGVDLFFVLSGFLIGGSLLRQREAGRGLHLGAYLAKRALRIVPAYFAVLLAIAFGLVPLYSIAAEGLPGRLAYHMLFLQDYFPSNILVVFWSLGVEEKFYLLAPLTIALALAAPQRSLQYAVVAGFAMLGLAGRYFTALAHPEVADYEAFFPVFRSPFHLCLDPLFIGLLAAMIYRDRQRWAWASSRRCCDGLFFCGLAIILCLAVPTQMLDEISWFDKTLQPTALSLGFGLLVLAGALGGGPLALLESTLLFWLSKLSYTLYLVHLALLPLTLGIFKILGGAPEAGGADLLLFIAVYAIVSLVAALLLHYSVEKPFLVLKDHLR